MLQTTETLLKGLASGDQNRWARFYRDYAPWIENLLLKRGLSHEDAEEVVNDTYLGVWNAIPPHRPDPLRTFVCRIARNLATKKYHADTAEKRNSRYDLALDELEDCLADRSGVEEALEAKELAEAINGFMATLSYADRFLFTRRYWYADPVQDVAAMAHATPNSVTVRLFRIRQKLKRYLEKEGLLV